MQEAHKKLPKRRPGSWESVKNCPTFPEAVELAGQLYEAQCREDSRREVGTNASPVRRRVRLQAGTHLVEIYVPKGNSVERQLRRLGITVSLDNI